MPSEFVSDPLLRRSSTSQPQLHQLHQLHHFNQANITASLPIPRKIMLEPGVSSDYRLAACWRIQNCHACTHSSHGCGWCPHSSACVPVSSLLQPVSDAKTCPSRDERFELRTRALGCGCSTATLLSIVVTVFATIAALFLLYGIGVLIKRANHLCGSGSWRGTELEVKDDGSRSEKEWRHHPWTRRFTAIFHRDPTTSANKSEQDLATERTRLLD